MHKLSTASVKSSVLTALRSLGLLDVLHEYACGASVAAPCQAGAFAASLRHLMHNPG